MDENNSNNNNWQQPPQMPPKKENPFKNKMFYIAYGATICILALISLILAGKLLTSLIVMIFLCIPYAVIGIVAWAIIRIKSKVIALGILLGSITPFAVVFFATGGCGFFGF